MTFFPSLTDLATKRHPLTGEPIRPLWVRPDGRVCWPIMGGAPDDGAGDNSGGDAGGDGDKGGAGDQGQGDKSTAGDKGFPENTPVAEMNADQRAAYWQHQARKHETRATEYRTAAGGKTAAEVQAELDAAATLRQSQMSDADRALEQARTTARQEAAAEFGTKAVRLAFEMALKNLSAEERAERVEVLDLTKFLTDSGDVDAGKVLTTAEKIAPAAKDTGSGRDYGNGHRGGGTSTGSVAAVMEARRAAREKKQ